MAEITDTGSISALEQSLRTVRFLAETVQTLTTELREAREELDRCIARAYEDGSLDA